MGVGGRKACGALKGWHGVGGTQEGSTTILTTFSSVLVASAPGGVPEALRVAWPLCWAPGRHPVEVRPLATDSEALHSQVSRGGKVGLCTSSVQKLPRAICRWGRPGLVLSEQGNPSTFQCFVSQSKAVPVDSNLPGTLTEHLSPWSSGLPLGLTVATAWGSSLLLLP